MACSEKPLISLQRRAVVAGAVAVASWHFQFRRLQEANDPHQLG